MAEQTESYSKGIIENYYYTESNRQFFSLSPISHVFCRWFWTLFFRSIWFIEKLVERSLLYVAQLGKKGSNNMSEIITKNIKWKCLLCIQMTSKQIYQTHIWTNDSKIQFFKFRSGFDTLAVGTKKASTHTFAHFAFVVAHWKWYKNNQKTNSRTFKC